MPEASETIGLSLTPDEIDLLRECMKRTEDYYTVGCCCSSRTGTPKKTKQPSP